MRDYKVYLAGPISHLTYGESTEWRDYAKERLSRGSAHRYAYSEAPEGGHWYEPTGIVGYSPMRAKEYLADVGVISQDPTAYDDQILSSAKGITYRDGWDVDTADVILVNFLGADKISAGTVWEIGRASTKSTPIVAAMEPDNVHNHPIINTSIGWICPDLDYAIDVVKAILLPDGVKVAVAV